MPWLLTRGERRRRNRLQGGRLHLGTVAGIKSEWWPTSSRNRWPACVGIRIELLDCLGGRVPRDEVRVAVLADITEDIVPLRQQPCRSHQLGGRALMFCVHF